MSYELVINGSKKIEGLLGQMGASGRGLHEKVTSIENNLPNSLVKRIRFIATVRNKLLHDADVKPTASILSDFQNACNIAEHELLGLIKKCPDDDNISWFKIVVVGVLVVVGFFSSKPPK